MDFDALEWILVELWMELKWIFGKMWLRESKRAASHCRALAYSSVDKVVETCGVEISTTEASDIHMVVLIEKFTGQTFGHECAGDCSRLKTVIGEWRK